MGPPFLVKSETANLFLFLVVYIYFASEVVVGCPLDPASDSEIQSWSMGNSLDLADCIALTPATDLWIEHWTAEAVFNNAAVATEQQLR